MKLLSAIIKELQYLFSDKCRLWKNCEVYLKDSWYCTQNSGLNCGTARACARTKDTNRKYPRDYISLKAILEDSQEIIV
jgi:hypothetical protein